MKQSTIRLSLLILLVPIGVLTFVLLWLSYTLEPFRGDLTRIGGFSANDYGWRSEVQQFSRPLHDKLARPVDITKPYDVILLGDSFSQEPQSAFQNYLAQATGLTIARFDITRVSVDEILSSAQWKTNPPRLFLYQTVERRLHIRAEMFTKQGSCTGDISWHGIPFAPRPLPEVLELRSRHDQPKPFNFNVPAQFLRAHLAVKKEAFPVSLNPQGQALFSHRQREETLIFYEDHDKYAYPPSRNQKAWCGLLNLQDKVQANGKTLFLAVVAPDKSSVYAPYILNPPLPYRNDLARFDKPPLHWVPLEKTLSNAVAEGAVDVYLPDDTHWGSTGSQQVAQSIADTLHQLEFLSAPLRS